MPDMSDGDFLYGKQKPKNLYKISIKDSKGVRKIGLNVSFLYRNIALSGEKGKIYKRILSPFATIGTILVKMYV